MKRTPLTRRTPLHRVRVRSGDVDSTGPTVPPVREGRWSTLRPVSAKRQRENRARTEALRPVREQQPWCSRCGVTGVALDGHELRSRARGGSITDPANIVLLCRRCHDWVTTHPTQATAEGWTQ